MPDDRPDDPAARLRVVSFNVRNGRAVDRTSFWWRRRAAALAALDALSADVIALQEAYSFQHEWLAPRLDMRSVAARGRNRGGGGESCPVLVGPAVSPLDGVVRWYGAEPADPGQRLPGATHPRIAALAEVRWAGLDVVIANTHLDQLHGANRAHSIDQLVTWIADRPVVLVGDFNAPPDAPELEPLAAAGLRRVALAGEVAGTSHGFHGRADLIDHCFVSDHWEVIAARVDHDMPRGRRPSDHWPIVIDLTWRG